MCAGTLSKVARKDWWSPACGPSSWTEPSGEVALLKKMNQSSPAIVSWASRPNSVMSKARPGASRTMPT